MNTQIVSPDQIDIALEVLKKGGLIAFPTDTVYGLGAMAFDQHAIESIYIAKDRPLEKAIPLLISSLEDLLKVTDEISQMAQRLASRFWPGPLTLVVPKKRTLPQAVSATFTVGVRIPDHHVARAILHSAGPMAVTSANISGEVSPVSAQEVYDQLNGRIPLIIDGGITPGGVPSSVVDCTGKEPVILREGPVSLKEILAALKP